MTSSTTAPQSHGHSASLPSSSSPPPTFPPSHPFIAAHLHDHIAGVLFGGALGDAVGLYTEFLSAGESKAAYPAATFVLAGDKPTPLKPDTHRLPHFPGDWTDDTDQALLLLLGFLHAGGRVSADEVGSAQGKGGVGPDSGSTERKEARAKASSGSDASGKLDHDEEDSKPVFTPTDFARRLHVWVHQGLRCLDSLPLGLGKTVKTVVQSKGYVSSPADTAQRVWARGGFRAAANGSLMRTHPLGVMCLGRSMEQAFELAGAFGATTHADLRCVVSCAVSVGLIRGLVLGEVVDEDGLDEVIKKAVGWVERRWKESKVAEKAGEVEDVGPQLDEEEFWRHMQAKSFPELKLDDATKMGYVLKTLGSGVLALRLAMRAMSRAANDGTQLSVQTALFERLITELVMEGGDADTNACAAGAVLGAYLGYKALPPVWVCGLKKRDWLMGKTESLSRVVGVLPGTYAPQQDLDTEIYGGKGSLSNEQLEKKWKALMKHAFAKAPSAEDTVVKRRKRDSTLEFFGKLKF